MAQDHTYWWKANYRIEWNREKGRRRRTGRVSLFSSWHWVPVTAVPLLKGNGPAGERVTPTSSSHCLTNNSPLHAWGWGHCQAAAGSLGEGKQAVLGLRRGNSHHEHHTPSSKDRRMLMICHNASCPFCLRKLSAWGLWATLEGWAWHPRKGDDNMKSFL